MKLSQVSSSGVLLTFYRDVWAGKQKIHEMRRQQDSQTKKIKLCYEKKKLIIYYKQS